MARQERPATGVAYRLDGQPRPWVETQGRATPNSRTASFSSAARATGTPQRLDSRHVARGRLRRIPQIDRTLRVEPEFRRVAKQLRHPQRHLRTHGAPTAQQLMDRLPRHADRLSQAGRGQSVVRQKILAQHFSRMSRPPLHLGAVGNAHNCCPASDNRIEIKGSEQLLANRSDPFFNRFSSRETGGGTVVRSVFIRTTKSCTGRQTLFQRIPRDIGQISTQSRRWGNGHRSGRRLLSLVFAVPPKPKSTPSFEPNRIAG